MEKNKYHLSARETDILYVLWESDRPLLASEIAEANEKLKLPTVHTTLKRMLDKNIVIVADFVKSGNVFGRRYAPTLSMQEFELNKLSNTTSHLMSTLHNHKDDKLILAELDHLEQMIKEQREKILNNK